MIIKDWPKSCGTETSVSVCFLDVGGAHIEDVTAS